MSLKDQIFSNIILFCCCSIAFYFTVVQFTRYFDNADNSILSYHQHKFDSESKEQYPTYSICISKDEFGGPLSSDFISDGIMRTFTRYRCGQSTCLRIRRDEALMKTLQSSQKQCYSSYFRRIAAKRFDSLSDIVIINVSNLMKLELDLAVYIHHAGQLIRHSLKSPETAVFECGKLRNLFIVNNKTRRGEVTFSISNVIILRNRENGMTKCNDSLLDEDKKWREIVSKNVDCVPSYWKTFYNESSYEKMNFNCTEDQLKQLKQHHEDPYLFANTSRQYANPCAVMQSQVEIDRKWLYNSHSSDINWDKMLLSLKIKYTSSRYLEILNKKAYDEETLLGQVGGYIGTFVHFY